MVTCLEWRDAGKRLEVAVPVKYCELVPDRTRGDQAVDARPDGDALATGAAIEIDRSFDDSGAQRALYDRER